MTNAKVFGRKAIMEMDKVQRLQMINALPGFKSAGLIGTINGSGMENLAIFNSLVHVGSAPPLLGCILRPTTVRRHTYENIKEMGWFTVNHIHNDIYKKAHQTSGNYRADISEFEVAGLTPQYTANCPAPYVKESNIQLGLTLEEEYQIKANGTFLLVGAIQEVRVPEDIIMADGYIDIERAGTVAISGIDSYHKTDRLSREQYVRVPPEDSGRDSI